jgi:hypothetical protein
MVLIVLIASHFLDDLVKNNILEIVFNYYNALGVLLLLPNYIHTSMPPNPRRSLNGLLNA